MEAHTTMAHSFHRCPHCSETFKFQTHLADHLKICSYYLNTNPKNKCYVCGEEFSLGLPKLNLIVLSANQNALQ